jgi:hypothetical protein
VNSPIVNSPISGSPISQPEEYQDFSAACAAGMPAGNRMFYFKFVGIMFAILGVALYGLFKLCDHMGWFN